MSVFVKGMKMPRNCIECPLQFGGICGVQPPEIDEPLVAETVDEAAKGRTNWCPLIEIQPHGDLIDRDALIKDGWLCLHKEVMRMGGYAIHELPLKNPSIHVIIEAEGGEY